MLMGSQLTSTPGTTPYGKALITDMPLAMVAAIKGIKTKQAISVFRWGGDYRRVKDTKHFEVITSPAELTQGIDWEGVVAEPPDPNDPKTWPAVVAEPADRRFVAYRIDRTYHVTLATNGDRVRVGYSHMSGRLPRWAQRDAHQRCASMLTSHPVNRCSHLGNTENCPLPDTVGS